MIFVPMISLESDSLTVAAIDDQYFLFSPQIPRLGRSLRRSLTYTWPADSLLTLRPSYKGFRSLINLSVGR